MCIRGVAHGLLEKVDRYLWSPRSTTLGPHMCHTFCMEKDMDGVKVQVCVHALSPSCHTLFTQQPRPLYISLATTPFYISLATTPFLRLSLPQEPSLPVSQQPLPPPTPLSPTLEEGGVHWGVRTGSTTCSLCRLPLISRVSERSPGLISFLCGE